MDLMSALDIIAQKAEKYEIKHLHLEALRKEMEDFRVCIAVVGAFSSGKSALLNALMGEEILAEGQPPETAIASELLYSEETYVEAVSGDNVTRYDVHQAGTLDTERYDYLRWRLRNDGLRKVSEYVLVDMPGFNSGIRAHNQAILRYAERANAYLLAIDVEDGAIKQSLYDFVREIRSYQDNLAIILTKCDIKTEEAVEEVLSGLRLAAEGVFGERTPIVALSSREPDAAREVLVELIRSFDRDSIYRQTFRNRTIDMGREAIGVLNVLLKNQNLKTGDLNQEIEKRERAKKEMARKLSQEQRRLSNEMQNQTLDAILNDARFALEARAPALAACIKSGGNGFSEKVNAILRPTLLSSVKRYTEENFDTLLSGLMLSGDDMEFGADFQESLLTGMKKSSDLLQLMSDSAEKYGGLYKAITGVLAVTTTFIAPWLEVLTFFLPDILKLFTGMKQRDYMEELEERVRGEVIPDIIQKLRPEVEQSLREIESRMMEELREQSDRQMELEVEALERLKQALSERKRQYAQTVEEIEGDIAEIQAALESV